MHDTIKTIIAGYIAIAILISCKTTSDINEIEYRDTEFFVSLQDFQSDLVSIDTIPDPNPEEPEYPGEEPEEEEPLPEEEEPEEDPDPIPDTIGIWKIR